jgi:RNA polymerase sigma-70 factor (ECF subfamily)
VARACGGDEGAFEFLFDTYSRRILNFIHASSGRDEDVSRDLLQETFLKVHSKLRGLKDPRRFESWLYAVASNSCRDHLRRKKRDPVADTDLVERTAAADPGAGLRDEADAVRKAVAAMPEKIRQVFIMKRMEERTFGEISGLLGCSVRTAKYRMELSWNFLMRELKRLGVRIPDREQGKG